MKCFKIHHPRVPMKCASMHRKWLQSLVCRNWCKLFHFKFLNQKPKSPCFQPSRAGPGIHHFCKRRTKILLGNKTRQLFWRCSELPAALAVWTPAGLQRLLSVVIWPRCPLRLHLCQVTGKINYIFKSTRAQGSSQEPFHGWGCLPGAPQEVWETSHRANHKSLLSPPNTTGQVRAVFHGVTVRTQLTWGGTGPCSELSSMREMEGGDKKRTFGGRQRQ